MKHTFLMAASIDGEEMADKIPASCQSFFNQDTAAMSSQELTFLLEGLGCQDVGFGHGTVQSILTGNLLYNAEGNPSNFSIFNFYEKLKDGSENSNTLLLHVMAKDSRTRSKEEINDSLKQVVAAPSSYVEMKDQTMIFICVSSIFSGKESLLTDYLKGFYNAIVSYASELKHKCKEDKLLPAKMLLGADQEVQ